MKNKFKMRLQNAKQGLVTISLSFAHANQNYNLLPVCCTKKGVDKEEVRVLTEWRNRYRSSFLTEFEATPNRTEKWLREAVAKDDTKVLFILRNETGQIEGYLGIAFIDWDSCSAEADAIVKGGELPKGTMKAALITLLNWAEIELGLKNFSVRVLEDNSAIQFYQKCGFSIAERHGLVFESKQEGGNWRNARGQEIPKRWIVHMKYNKERQ